MIRTRPHQLHHYVFSFMLMAIGILAMILAGCSTDSNGDSGSNGDPQFSSGTVPPGETFSYTFRETGNVDYHCDIHEPDMRGTVTVEQGAADSGQVSVSMENSQFVPQQITIAPQTTVEWVNNDNVNHTVTSGEPSGGDGGGGGGGY